MSRWYARLALAGCAAAIAASVGLTAAFAMTTWTIKPGGAFTATAMKPTLRDSKTRSVFNCKSLTFTGTLKSGSGLSGSDAGSISAVSAQNCSGALGENITLTATDLPWHVNLSSFGGGVAAGSISHMQIQFAFPSCTAVIDGTSATASDGRLKFSYTDSTGHLTIPPAGGNLHFYNVRGCAGLVITGDGLTLNATFTLSPTQAITRP